MVTTTRIRSGFDVELQIGRGWVLVALQTLAAEGLLLTPPPPLEPDARVAVDDVTVMFEPDGWDLKVDLVIGGLPFSALAGIELSESGTELVVTNDTTDDVSTIPFDVLDDLAGVPTLVKLRGDDTHEPCFALLANLDLRAGPQDGDPLPAGEHLPRGQALLAQSFPPAGTDVAVGIGQQSFPRFANDIWHTTLRAADGSHPLPDAENAIGTWHVASSAPEPGRIRITLVGEVPIDLWPDATVTVDVHLSPRVVDGAITFSLELDTDIDTGLLGDLFGGVVGGLIGLLLGLITGGALLPVIGAGFFAGVLAVEIAEAVAGGIVKRRVRAAVDGEPVPPQLSCDDGVVVEAIPSSDDGGLALGVLSAIPRSVTIASTDPDALHRRHLQVTTDYQSVTADGNGLAFTGTARAGEAFEPTRSALVAGVRSEEGDLATLVYRAADGADVALDVAEAQARAADDELTPPLRLVPVPSGSDILLRGGRLPVVCLSPVAIRRGDTVVTDIRFGTGLELAVPETVELQDGGVLVLPDLQLIHPVNADPYYRSAPDDTTENNFENLPPF